MTTNNIQYHDSVRKNYLYDLHQNINESVKNKAMLSLKYDDLNFWITLVQVSIIFISTGLTVMNSIKSYYGVKSQVIDLISIIMTALIGLIMAIYRFYKMDERKENLCNLRDNYTSIINKFNKILHRMDRYVITDENIDEWTQIVSTYQEETIDAYLGIKETFGTIFDYKDIIYYKNKFKRLYLQHEIVNNEIETVHYFKKRPVSVYKNSDETEKTPLCNQKSNVSNVAFNSFVNHYEKEYLEAYQHNLANKKRNQDIYSELVLQENNSTVTNQETTTTPKKSPNDSNEENESNERNEHNEHNEHNERNEQERNEVEVTKIKVSESEVVSENKDSQNKSLPKDENTKQGINLKIEDSKDNKRNKKRNKNNLNVRINTDKSNMVTHVI